MESLLETMAETGADFTNTFRCLSRIPLPGHAQFDEKVRRRRVIGVFTFCASRAPRAPNRPTYRCVLCSTELMLVGKVAQVLLAVYLP